MVEGERQGRVNDVDAEAEVADVLAEAAEQRAVQGREALEREDEEEAANGEIKVRLGAAGVVVRNELLEKLPGELAPDAQIRAVGLAEDEDAQDEQEGVADFAGDAECLLLRVPAFAHQGPRPGSGDPGPPAPDAAVTSPSSCGNTFDRLVAGGQGRGGPAQAVRVAEQRQVGDEHAIQELGDEDRVPDVTQEDDQPGQRHAPRRGQLAHGGAEAEQDHAAFEFDGDRPQHAQVVAVLRALVVPAANADAERVDEEDGVPEPVGDLGPEAWDPQSRPVVHAHSHQDEREHSRHDAGRVEPQISPECRRRQTVEHRARLSVVYLFEKPVAQHVAGNHEEQRHHAGPGEEDGDERFPPP